MPEFPEHSGMRDAHISAGQAVGAVWEVGVHIPYWECLEDRWVLGEGGCLSGPSGEPLGLPVDEVRNSGL